MSRKFLLLFSFCLLATFGTFVGASSESETSTTHGPRYPSKNITYKISKYSRQMSHSDVKNIIEKAFETWSNVTDLTFTRKRASYAGSVDIDVRFETGSHGDDRPFGHGGYGFVHFDDNRRWSKGFGSDVFNLYSVAVHDIGHALGVSHSNVRDAMMYSIYDPSHPVMQLHNDDIRAIQSLYGVKDGAETNTCDDETSGDCSSGSNSPTDEYYSPSGSYSPTESFYSPTDGSNSPTRHYHFVGSYRPGNSNSLSPIALPSIPPGYRLVKIENYVGSPISPRYSPTGTN